MMQSPNLLCHSILKATSAYDVLSLAGERLTSSSPKDRVRRAYLKLAAATHPDKAEVLQAHDAFQRVTWAYRSISDPDSINQSDGWQEDDAYQRVKTFTGQWYQDLDGRWYTDWDYRDEQGRWHKRSVKEVEVLLKVKRHGLPALTTPEEAEVYQRVYRQAQVMALAQEKDLRKGRQTCPNQPNQTFSAPHSPASYPYDQAAFGQGDPPRRRNSLSAHDSALNGAGYANDFRSQSPTMAFNLKAQQPSGPTMAPDPRLTATPGNVIKGYDYVSTPTKPSVLSPASAKVTAAIQREHARRQREDLKFQRELASKEEEIQQIRRKLDCHRGATERRAVEIDLHQLRREVAGGGIQSPPPPTPAPPVPRFTPTDLTAPAALSFRPMYGAPAPSSAAPSPAAILQLSPARPPAAAYAPGTPAPAAPGWPRVDGPAVRLIVL